MIKGGSWVVDGGSMTGSGVTFYFADTSLIQFNGGMTLTLSAPTTGTYAGILMYEKDGLSKSQLELRQQRGRDLDRTDLSAEPRRHLQLDVQRNDALGPSSPTARPSISELEPVTGYDVDGSAHRKRRRRDPDLSCRNRDDPAPSIRNRNCSRPPTAGSAADCARSLFSSPLRVGWTLSADLTAKAK